MKEKNERNCLTTVNELCQLDSCSFIFDIYTTKGYNLQLWAKSKHVHSYVAVGYFVTEKSP